MAYSYTPSGESMWDANKGGGAALYYYIIVLPISAIAQVILLILKIVFASNSK